MHSYREYMERQAAVMARAGRLYRVSVLAAVLALGAAYRAKHWNGQ